MLVRAIVAIVLVLLPASAFAQAEKRIALLIGNRDYKAGVGALTNPLNDIRIVGDALKSVGFEVMKPTQNATRAVMLRAIIEFAAKLKTAGPDAVGFLYYSGHGIASAGENYLIPVEVEEPSTTELSVQGVKQSEVLAILSGEAPNAAHYLVLDACRHTLQGARGGKGFMPVRQQSGVLVAFSTEPGKTAADLGPGSGPYAAALAAELVKPPQDDLLMFHNVRIAVMDKTSDDQVPWTEDGIRRRQRIKFGVKPTPPAPLATSEINKFFGQVGDSAPATPGPQLTASELATMAATIKSCVQSKWSVRGGEDAAQNTQVKLRIRFNPDGRLAGEPQIMNPQNTPYFLEVRDSAVHALRACEPFSLPPAKYNFWKDIVLNFDPRDTF